MMDMTIELLCCGLIKGECFCASPASRASSCLRHGMGLWVYCRLPFLLLSRGAHICYSVHPAWHLCACSLCMALLPAQAFSQVTNLVYPTNVKWPYSPPLHLSRNNSEILWVLSYTTTVKQISQWSKSHEFWGLLGHINLCYTSL